MKNGEDDLETYARDDRAVAPRRVLRTSPPMGSTVSSPGEHQGCLPSRRTAERPAVRVLDHVGAFIPREPCRRSAAVLLRSGAARIVRERFEVLMMDAAERPTLAPGFARER